MASVQIKYYAMLKERTGKKEESLELRPGETGGQLYERLRGLYDFPLAPEELRLAVNESFVSMNVPLQDRDLVVFIPPVAGG